MSADVYSAGFDAMVTRMHAGLHGHDECIGCRVAAAALAPAVIDAVRPLIEADLRERLASAIEALAPAAPPFLAHEATRHIQTRRGALLDAARIVRTTP
jgi:hypothetical protein